MPVMNLSWQRRPSSKPFSIAMGNARQQARQGLRGMRLMEANIRFSRRWASVGVIWSYCKYWGQGYDMDRVLIIVVTLVPCFPITSIWWVGPPKVTEWVVCPLCREQHKVITLADMLGHSGGSMGGKQMGR